MEAHTGNIVVLMEEQERRRRAALEAARPSPKLQGEFRGIVEAAMAVLSAEGDVNGKWITVADRFFLDFVTPYYDRATREVKVEARTYIAAVTGQDYKVAAQDRSGLSTAARFFFGTHIEGRVVSRQAINRLSYLGAAGTVFGNRPSVLLREDKKTTKGTINGLVRAASMKLNGVRTAQTAKRAESREAIAARAMTVDAADPSTPAADKSLALLKVLREFEANFGRSFNETDDKELVLRFAGKPRQAKLAGDKLEIKDERPHWIKVVRVTEGFRVTWCDVPGPTTQQDREVQQEEEQRQEKERRQGE